MGLGRPFALPLLALGALLAVLAGVQAHAGDVLVRAPAGGDFQLPITSFRDMPFRTVVRQQYDFSCGSAALATLLRYHYGMPLTESDVFKAMYAVGDQAAVRKLGFSLLDMKRYLATEGMTADGYRLPLDVLAKTRTPAIAVINVRSYKHFVVIKGLRGGAILVGDPAIGLKAYSLNAFAKMWDGIIFVIHERSPRAPVHKAVFDSDTEWSNIPSAPLKLALYQDLSISELTRNLPIAFQLTPTVSSAGFGAGQ